MSVIVENPFQALYDVDVREKTKQKNKLNYLSWAAAWAEVKKRFPDATFTIYEYVMDERGNKRPWFDDGRTGWVKTGVTIAGVELIEELPIMDFKNQSIPAEKITSTDANKAVQRSLTKACARHGLGLYIYEGEDLPEETKKEEKRKAEAEKSELEQLGDASFELCKKICVYPQFKAETGAICKKYTTTGNPKKVTDLEAAKKLNAELLSLAEKLPKE